MRYDIIDMTSDFANLGIDEAQLIYNPATLECFKEHRSFAKYNDCLSQLGFQRNNFEVTIGAQPKQKF